MIANYPNIFQSLDFGDEIGTDDQTNGSSTILEGSVKSLDDDCRFRVFYQFKQIESSGCQ
jgi:hypothetical protein